MAERDLLYRAKFQDDVTPAHDEMIARATASAGRMGAAERAWNTEIQQVRSSILEQRDALVLRKEALDDPATQRAIRESKQLRDEIKALTGEMKPEPVRSFSQEWQEMASKYFLVTQAAQTLGRGIMAVVDAAKEYDSVRTRLTATEGSSLVADKDLHNLQELAKLPGLGFSQASQAMASLRSLHVSAADTFQLIEGIARGNASMGGGAEEFSRVMYQISQSIGKSKVDMQDLKPVMEAIPNMGAMIQEKFGSIDSEAINKKLESMGKTSKDFWMDIAEMAKNLPPAGDTISNNIDNIGDAWTRFKASLANTDVIKGATSALSKFIDAVARRNENAEETNNLRERAQANLGKRSFFSQLLYGDTGGEKDVEAEMARIKASDDARAYAISAVNAQKDEAAAKEAAERKKADEKKEKDDKEAEKRRAANAKRVAAHNLESQKNIETNFDGSVTLRSGIEYDEGVDPEHIRNREKAEAKRVQREQQEIADRQKLEANAHKIKMDWVGAEAAQKKRAHEEEMRQLQERVEAVRGFGAAELSQALQGKLTIRGLEADLTAFLAEQFAQRTTKWIAEEFIKSAAASSIQVGQTAASVAQAATVSAAWATPSLEISMATFGSSAAVGSAAWFNALAAGQAVGGLPMRARGGPLFGDGIVGERGQERITPIVPSVITPSHKTTTNNYGGVTVIVKGAVDSRTLRNIREAVTDRRQSPR